MKRLVEGVRAFWTKFGKTRGQPPEDETPTDIRRRCRDVSEESDVVVGREDAVEELVSRLLLLDDNDESLRVISVVGDEGLGKTALVRNVYNRLDIRHHFPWRAWVHVSGDHLEYKDLLLIILKQFPVCVFNNLALMSEKEMHDMLFLYLAEHKFLIVLDDLCKVDVWYNLVRSFADAFNGSRVILTTRDIKVASRADPWSSPLKLSPLTEEKSWSLLLKNVVREDHNTELNNVREDILRICHGLPLAIVLLGGVLSTIKLSEWSNKIGHLSHQMESESSALSKIIDFSYDKLPSTSLQKCFLYLTLFPKAFEIPIRRLLHLWFVEEFVILVPGESIPRDEAAKIYFEELVCRNMIEIARWKSDGSPKTCRMPSFLYDHFLSKAREILQVHHCKPDCSCGIYIKRLADQFGFISTSEYHIRCLCTYVSFNPRKRHKSNKEIGKFLNKIINRSNFLLLKVLDLEGVYKPLLPEKLGKLQNLRYIGLRWTVLDSCPLSIGELPRLETLDLKYTDIITLPSSIWKANLRHLYMNEVSINEPPKESLANLETLMGLFIGAKDPETYCSRFSNLRKLGIICNSNSAERTAACISGLSNLQTLRLRSTELTVRGVRPRTGELVLHPMTNHQSLSNLYLPGKINESIGNVPRNLRTLTLSKSELKDDPMPVLGVLPQLNILRLFAHSYAGSEMTCHPGHFRQLRVLKIWMLENLQTYTVEEGAMAQLVKLEIRGCNELRTSVGLDKLVALKELILTKMPEEFVADIRKRMSRGILLTNEWKFSANI